MAFSSSVVAQDAESNSFKRIKRPGAVDLKEEYDLSGLSIPEDEIHCLLPKDRIPSLTDPETEAAKDSAEWLKPTSRLIVVQIGNETLGVPIQILDAHEVVNVSVGDEPVAVTYCPLCDSAAVFSRRVVKPDGSTIDLEFGVSGALYNSNVLMYDRTHKGLWSQLGMQAVSGVFVGKRLSVLPIKVLRFEAFVSKHPDAPVVSRNTSYRRDYARSPYAGYFFNDRLAVPVKRFGDALKKKTLGVGVLVGDKASFVPVNAIGENGYTLETAAGDVRLTSSKSGVVVESKPKSVLAMQTFYYSWSAFYPDTEVIHKAE
ncbi:MAG: DUF3179 domain-containing (seleno)protein [Planctomycetota bacterium]